MMNGPEKSDSVVVAKKPANKAGQPAAERAEPRPGTKGNAGQPHTRRIQSRCSVSPGLDRVRARFCRQTPKVGAQCVNRARWNLCGGRPAMGAPPQSALCDELSAASAVGGITIL